MTPPPDPETVLGLDAGGSGTKWVLQRGEERLGAGRVSPLTALTLPTPAGEAALAELRAALPELPTRLHAGLPGLSAGSPQADEIREPLAAALGLRPERVTVEGDLDLAYRAHFAPGEGVLIYAGTGSIAYHVSAEGQVFRAGGRGYRIGDDGGGASLGRAALRWVTEPLDFGREARGPLAEEIAGVTGGLDWPALRAFTYAAPGAAALARLAPAVGRAADRGDGAALGMLTEAAAALAELGRRVAGQVGRLPVVATGGALRVSPLFPERLARELPGVRVQWRDHAEEAACRPPPLP